MEPVEAGGAKAHLCERLDRVTRLMPEVASEPPDVQAVIDEIKEFRKGRILGGVATIRELIDGGRKY